MKINKKKIQREYAKKSISKYFNLIAEEQFSPYHKKYIKEIQKISQTFNIRLNKEEKLQYCKKCHIPWNKATKQIRLNPLNSCIEYICLNCNFTRRYKYK